MKRSVSSFSLCLSLGFALAASAQQGPPYSAFAEYDGEEGWAVGYTLGYDTSAEADAEAIEACNKQGVGNCTVAYRFTGPGCVTIAESEESMGYWFGGSLTEVKEGAMSECRKRGGNCHIVEIDCVGNEKIVQSNVVEKEPAAGNPGEEFRDCNGCPEMVIVPAGSFMMGSPSSEEGRFDSEGPQHRVTVDKFAVGRYEVTVSEFARFVSATGHSMGNSCHTYENGEWKDRTGYGWQNPGFSQGETDPVVCVNWEEAKEYVKWLSKKTGKRYRLLSESEWEYAARAGTNTPYHTGRTISSSQANYHNDKTVAVGSYPANQFGLHDMHGNVWEWVEDCWHNNYRGAPSNGSAWTTGGNCAVRVLRGGSWSDRPRYLRAAIRIRYDTALRSDHVGFRVARVVGVARTLTP